jgi:polyhydroxybutyrate depolymerase
MNTPWGRRLGAVSVVGAVITAVLVVGVVKVARHHDGSSAVAVAASKGCAGTGTANAAPAGVSHDAIISSGAVRSFRLFVPTGAASGSAPRPLVVDLHGYTEGADVHASFTGWEAKAQQVGAVVLTPQGQTDIKFWSLGFGKGIDDVVTVGDLLDHVEAVACIDTDRVFVDGFSNGAMLTTVLACRLSERIAAFGPVSGIWDPKACAPRRPVPIITFHGTADPFLPYDGGVGQADSVLPESAASADALSGFTAGAVPASTKAWAVRDGCSTTPTTSRVAAHVIRTTYGSCRDGAAVVLYTQEGAGHTWPGSPTMDAIAVVTGPVNHEISADDLLWAFFSSHPLRP